MHIPVLFSAAAYTAGYLFNQKKTQRKGQEKEHGNSPVDEHQGAYRNEGKNTVSGDFCDKLHRETGRRHIIVQPLKGFSGIVRPVPEVIRTKQAAEYLDSQAVVIIVTA